MKTLTESQKKQAAKALYQWEVSPKPEIPFFPPVRMKTLIGRLKVLQTELAKVGLCITEKDAPSEAASAIHCSACGEPLICEDQRAVHRCPNPQSKPQSK